MRSGLWGLLALLLVLAAVLNGCVPAIANSRMICVQALNIGPGTPRIAENGLDKLLVVQVSKPRPLLRKESEPDLPSDVMTVDSPLGDDCEKLVRRIGTPSGVEIMVADLGEFGPDGFSERGFADRARELGARWMLVWSTENMGNGITLLQVLSVLTAGVIPCNVGCTAYVNAALYDLRSGTCLESWSLSDSGWQITTGFTGSSAYEQIEARARRRMLTRISREAANELAGIDPRFKASVEVARMRLDGWGE